MGNCPVFCFPLSEEDIEALPANLEARSAASEALSAFSEALTADFGILPAPFETQVLLTSEAPSFL